MGEFLGHVIETGAMPVATNHAGRTFGRITLSAPVPGKSGYWQGTCSCGNPVQKRLDNLKRPGDPSCGRCLAPAPATNFHLEERVRRLEELVARLSPQVEGEVRKARPGTDPSPPASRFSNVSYDAEGDLWEAHSLSGRAFFWGATEEEAAYAVRFYLDLTHATFNNRIINDTEITLSEERREEIEFEISQSL